MKKILAMLLLVCMVFAMAACGQQAAPAEKPAEAPAEAPAEVPAEAPAAEYKLGMGIDMKMSEEKAQIDATTAAVVLDADGKIVAVKIDVAQNKMDVTDGLVDTEATFETKKELKEKYGMSGIGKVEWYLQVAALEEFLIGKSVEEIEGIELVEDGEHMVFADETLKASCSISVEEIKNAVVKACKDEQGMSFTADGAFKLGLAIISNAKDSTAATAEEDGTVKMYSEYAAAVVGEDGKILAAVTDATQPNIKIDAEGAVVETSYRDTKRALKEDYGMSGIGKVEWYLQAAEFEKFAVGKTAEEIRGEALVQDGEHMVFADETLKASCSISVSGMVEVMAKAADNAVA